MRPRRTPNSNAVIRLPGGTEDNDLHARVGHGYERLADNDPGRDNPYIVSVWEPEPAERAAIGAGRANIELVVLGEAQPAVIVTTTREQPLSRPQRIDDGPRIWLELPRQLAVDVAAVIGAIDTLADLAPDQRQRLYQLGRTISTYLAALDAQEPAE